MSDLISREALIKEVLESREAFRRGHSKTDMHDLMCDNVISWVEGAEAVDAVPVVHGEFHHNPYGFSACSVCREEFETGIIKPYNYCPNCGARMDGGDKG